MIVTALLPLQHAWKMSSKKCGGGNAVWQGEGEPSSGPKDSGRSPAGFVFFDMGHQIQPM